LCVNKKRFLYTRGKNEDLRILERGSTNTRTQFSVREERLCSRVLGMQLAVFESSWRAILSLRGAYIVKNNREHSKADCEYC